jgi:hypothetical protein
VRRADSLATFTSRLSKNSGKLNLLEPSGPVEGCLGIAAPLPFTASLGVVPFTCRQSKGYFRARQVGGWAVYKILITRTCRVLGIGRLQD